MAQELVTMSAKELKRLEVIRRVVENRWPHARAAALLGLMLPPASEGPFSTGITGDPGDHPFSDPLTVRIDRLVGGQVILVPVRDVLFPAGTWLMRVLHAAPCAASG